MLAKKMLVTAATSASCWAGCVMQERCNLLKPEQLRSLFLHC